MVSLSAVERIGVVGGKRRAQYRQYQSLQPVAVAGWHSLTVLIVLGWMFTAPSARGDARHPLDALSAEEIEAAVALVGAHDPTDEPRRFPLVHLREPAKEKIRVWTVGQPVPRAAYVVERRGRKTFAGVVDLAAGRVTEWNELETDAYLLEDEVLSLTEIVIADPRMNEALTARGVTEPSAVRCLPLAVVGGPDDGRTVRALCWDGTDLENFFSRPLGGLEIVVDLDGRRVERFVDHGAQPLSTGNHAYDEATMGTRKRLAPLVQEQPAGTNFTLDGGVVRWQTWSFHFRFDPRRGPVISLVHVWDRAQRRSVLYQGSLAEVFVPYRLEADGSWLGWTAASRGLAPTPLAAGLDCPAYATLVDAVVADDRGRPRRVEGALAIFERRTGDPVWRHYDAFGGAVESRPAMELVVRSIVRLGTYDYVLDWIFSQAGSLRVSVGMTGLLVNEGVATVFLSEPSAAADTVSGDLMAANVVAPHHEHRLSFRLDLDVDGPVNSLIREDLEPVRPEQGRLGLVKRVPRTLRRESEARLSPDVDFWRIVGTTRKTDVGHVPGFTLDARSSARPSPEPSERAGLAAHPLRVTRYHPDELDVPAENENRPIEATDLVLWHTVGLRHVPRLEEFPVIPTQWRTFELVPFNFFEKNPAIDLRSGFASSRR